jgi:riboflavin transporter FmnP
MEAKQLAIIAVFTAISVVLVLSPFKIPAPYAPFLYYQIWEIPLVTAFLVYGPLTGLSIAGLNTLILVTLFPGDLPTGPLYNLGAVASMLSGVYIIHHYLQFRGRTTIRVPVSTALSMVVRVLFMSLINWLALRYPYPIGFSMPEEAIMAVLPLIGLFNATVVLYTIPMGYILAQAVSRGTQTKPWSIIEQP